MNAVPGFRAAPSGDGGLGAEPSVAPLSFAQERLWFLDRMDPGSPLYNIFGALRLRGQLNVDALGGALAALVVRHEGLRTTFRFIDGEVFQVIAPAVNVELPLVDLSVLSPDCWESEVARRAEAEARAPFDLEKGPLLRVQLLRRSGEENVLLLSMHHIVSDGWSLRVFFRELGVLYDAQRRGMPSPLQDLSIQYADYSTWQREHLRGEVLERLLRWWRRHLDGAPALLDVPGDHPRPAERTYRGGRREVVLGKGLMERVQKLARQEGATPFMVLLGSFAALLSRHTGERRIVIGSPIANRLQRETEEVIGFFVNTLVLNTDVSGDPSFHDLLGRVRESTLDAYAHQDLPFERLVEELRPERSLGYNPLFQVMLVLQNVPDSVPSLSGVEVQLLPAAGGMAKFDLMLAVFERDGESCAGLEYAVDLFDAATAERIMERWRVLLEGAVAHPDLLLSELPLLPAAEQKLLLNEWNLTERPYPGPRTISELFSGQARRSPEAVALLFEGQTMTYGELEGRSNQLAQRLRRLGVGPEVRVGICAERSLELVVGLLGILKAGGAYVPIDPAYPAERVAFMLSDAAVPVLLAQERLLEGLPEHRAEVVLLDAHWADIAQESEADPRVKVDPENVAYVIYTSGSTGRPKGVEVPHRGVVNVLRWLEEVYPFDGYERVLLKASLSFDASVWELFWPLATGGSVVIAHPDGHRDAEYLVRTIADQGVSTFHFIPSMLPIFLEAARGLDFPRLRRVICGGEALPVEVMDRVLAQFGAEIHNWYGPTETTIGSIDWTATRGVEHHTIPIGRPIANIRVYVLNEALRPVPVGVPAELWVGGIGVTRGYLGRPGLTAERFAPDPFSGEPGMRLYRTGDRARWRTDGLMEVLGRLDDQVKIRGVRIELGEIETLLLSHPAVREAAVVVREDTPGDKRLVAYVVSAQGRPPTVGELRAAVGRALPEYMVPSSFVFLEALPLAPTGKLDRKALPSPDGERPDLQAGYIPPANDTEHAIASIWAHVLGMVHVGAEDPFFELGGHSLLLVQVNRKLRERFGREVPIVEMFRHRTVRALARYIDSESHVEDDTVRRAREAARRQREAMDRQRGHTEGRKQV